MNCKDCKHWLRIRNRRYQYYAPVNGLPHGTPYTCEDIPNNETFKYVDELPPSGFGHCKCPSIGEGIGPENTYAEGCGHTDMNDELSIEGDRFNFVTGENFGCIHYTESA